MEYLLELVELGKNQREQELVVEYNLNLRIDYLKFSSASLSPGFLSG